MEKEPDKAQVASHPKLPDGENLALNSALRKAEADRLITESQELFAQQKSVQAIQLLRQAYELDKKNSLARTILANALVEHAQTLVQTNWLEAEKLTNQAVALNPAHPTAKTVLDLIVERKKTSSEEDWVTHARKLQSSGDLFEALAWVAEGLAVHPDDPKLLQIQNEIQKDQAARRRQTRRRDLEELRRMELEIDGAAETAAKEALSERIQGVAARYWTDGEMLSVANTLLQRLGFTQDSSSSRQPGPIIFHVPRSSAPRLRAADAKPALVKPASAEKSAIAVFPASSEPEMKAAAKIPTVAEPPLTHPQATDVPLIEPASQTKSRAASSVPRETARFGSRMLVLIFGLVAATLIAAGFFVVRKHPTSPVAAVHPESSANSTPLVPEPAAPAPEISSPGGSNPAVSTPEPANADEITASGAPGVGGTNENKPAKESVQNSGTLLILAGQDNASVFLDGKLQRPSTKGGQLLLSNLEPKDYIVRISKNGFVDPPQQKIRIRKGEEGKVTFNLQPQPSASLQVALLTIHGGLPGTAVFLDQSQIGTVQSDGAFSYSGISPGERTVELRKDKFAPRQLKEHFVAGSAIFLGPAETTLEYAPAEMKINFTPADANVALVKGEVLKIVNSGVPLTLAPGAYTLTARTADRFTRSAMIEVSAGQVRTVDLSLAPNGMSRWEDPSAWRREGDSFTRKGGEFVLYGAVPISGTFVFSATPTKGHLLQWVLDYTDSKNYVLFQMDENYFYRIVIRNGQKMSDIRVSDKGDKKSLRTLHILVSSTEIVHQVKHGDSWTVVDRWTQPGVNLGQGKFGFYIPGSDQIELSGFAHYADLNIR